MPSNEAYTITFEQLLDFAKDTVLEAKNRWSEKLNDAITEDFDSLIPYLSRKVAECYKQLEEIERLQETRAKGILTKNSPLKF